MPHRLAALFLLVGQIFEPARGQQPLEAVSEPSYDAIVVGAGLTGSVVAARLRTQLAAGLRILVLEAGVASQHSLGGSEPPAYLQGGRWVPWTGADVNNLTRYDVPGNYPVMQCWDRTCAESWQELPSFQCKILGGCGVMNGAFSQVPSAKYFDSWPLGWNWPDVKPYFDEARKIFTLTQTPSRDGYNHLCHMGAAYLRRALESIGLRADPGLEPKAGTFGAPYVTASGGLRESSASVMLGPALQKGGLELWLEAEVLEILHDGRKAFGVRVKRHGVEQKVLLSGNGVLVLTSGALGSARLLLSSGIGPKGSTKPGGSQPTVQNPHVGQGVSDHTFQQMLFDVPSSEGVAGFLYTPPGQGSLELYARTRSGPLAQFGPSVAAYIRDPSTAGERDEWDVEVFVQPASVNNSINLGFMLMRPSCSGADLKVEAGSQGKDRAVFTSEGTLHLGCERDRRTMAYAMDLVSKTLTSMGAHETSRGPPVAANHWAGSCSVGSCVDPKNLRLRGLESVAVADASILPGQVWGHPALTLHAVALRAADLIAASVGTPQGPATEVVFL